MFIIIGLGVLEYEQELECLWNQSLIFITCKHCHDEVGQGFELE